MPAQHLVQQRKQTRLAGLYFRSPRGNVNLGHVQEGDKAEADVPSAPLQLSTPHLVLGQLGFLFPRTGLGAGAQPLGMMEAVCSRACPFSWLPACLPCFLPFQA